jgi:hypothetical protein
MQDAKIVAAEVGQCRRGLVSELAETFDHLNLGQRSPAAPPAAITDTGQ